MATPSPWSSQVMPRSSWRPITSSSPSASSRGQRSRGPRAWSWIRSWEASRSTRDWRRILAFTPRATSQAFGTAPSADGESSIGTMPLLVGALLVIIWLEEAPDTASNRCSGASSVFPRQSLTRSESWTPPCGPSASGTLATRPTRNFQLRPTTSRKASCGTSAAESSSVRCCGICRAKESKKHASSSGRSSLCNRRKHSENRFRSRRPTSDLFLTRKV
mmetsp:Transcript_21581/g.53225  ORF Transcript_21581/g.53225 Transcript_21581/m.53225 type:complete len:219 (+) Transcript_21581:833-1489(+)